jgi:hypothetical protein
MRIGAPFSETTMRPKPFKVLGSICANNTAAQDKCMVENVRAKGAARVATAAVGDLARLAELDLRLNYRMGGPGAVA